MKLGTVTYNIAAEWDCDTIIEKCTELGLAGAELRTTHAHGVEVDLSAGERASVRARFADSPIELVGLGSAFEYHAVDPAELRSNIDGTKQYIELARDVGAAGVKVRPNSLPEGVPVEKTVEQIGIALREVGQHGADLGVKIRLEVHGHGTSHPPLIRQMLDVADHPNVYACWNGNMADLDEGGSIAAHFDMLKDRIEICHINVLWNEYPWADLFARLSAAGFDGFCLAEIPGSTDPDTVLRYYKALFTALQPPA